MAPGDDFYSRIDVFRHFPGLVDEAHYAPLPGGWVVGVADIVDSTSAIAKARYKAVNMAGAAVIAAVTNELDGRDFPFIFGGDGASFAVSSADADKARNALAATAAWVKDDLDLTLRVALVPIEAIRAQGLDVRIGRFGPSPNLSYAMFMGGGLPWAEAAMKRGEFTIAPAPHGTHPNLDGLSCRFSEIPAARGVILSVLVTPRPQGDPNAYKALLADIVTRVEASPDAGRPVPADGPRFKWPANESIEYEARAMRGGSLMARRLAAIGRAMVAFFFIRSGLKIGNFASKVYLAQVAENSDFRKYDDGLRMVLDCTPELADSLEAQLAQASRAGIIRYGLHRQSAALMTCFTPSATRSDHVHFVDGAQGGYASAATALKAMAI